MRDNEWVRLLAYVTGLVNQRLLLQNGKAVLTGVDFFTVEVLTWRGLATYYVLLFLQLETRRVTLVRMDLEESRSWAGLEAPRLGQRQ